METPRYERALIVGAGTGLSAALARGFSHEGMKVALASRNTEKLAPLCTETGARAFRCDAVRAVEVRRLFTAVEGAVGEPDVVVYNASARARGPLVELDPAEVERTLAVTAFGAFLVAQEAALAYTLETGVVAEGVEDEVQALALERLGCRYAQGYLFSPAIPPARVEELLVSGQSLVSPRRLMVDRSPSSQLPWAGRPAARTGARPDRSHKIGVKINDQYVQVIAG